MGPLKYSQNKIVGTLLASQSLLSASMILIFSVSSLKAVELAGGNANWAGVPSTVMVLGSAAVAYPIGRLMDAAGRRIGLSVGHVLGGFGGALTAWAIMQGSLWLFLAGIFVLGLARGAVELGRYAAADAVQPARRGRAISLVVLGGTVGSLIGPTLIALSHRIAPQIGVPEAAAPWLMAGGFFVIGVLVINLLLHPDPHRIALYLGETGDDPSSANLPARPLSEIFADWRMRLAVGAMIFSQLSMVIVMTITPLHMQGHHHEEVTIAWVIMAHTLGMYGLSFLTGWLADKIGRTRMIFAGGILSTLACILAPFSTTALWLGIMLFVLGLGWNFAFVAGSTLLDDVLRASEKGRVQGSADAAVKIVSGMGSLSSGPLFSLSSYAMTSWMTVIAAIIPALLVVALAGMRQGSEPMPEAAPGSAD